MIRYIFAALLLTIALQAGAVNKCITNGKTAYQDAPCPNEGVTLANIQPETESEKLRRKYEAAIVSQNLTSVERPRLANELGRDRRKLQRRMIPRSDSRREAAVSRAAHRRAGDGKHRKSQFKIQRRLRTLSGVKFATPSRIFR
jgi:hypothetical protein